jgi:hypothetical protein
MSKSDKLVGWLLLAALIAYCLFLARQAKLEDFKKECEGYGYTEFVLPGAYCKREVSGTVESQKLSYLRRKFLFNNRP